MVTLAVPVSGLASAQCTTFVLFLYRVVKMEGHNFYLLRVPGGEGSLYFLLYGQCSGNTLLFLGCDFFKGLLVGLKLPLLV